MQSQEFNRELNRLKDCFGDKNYSDERVKILWSEVKDLTGDWFIRVINFFIGNQRQPPLIGEFREEIAKERDRQWKIKKTEHSQDAKDFWNGTYQPDEVKWICETIRNRMRKNILDENWEKFIEHLNYTASSSRILIAPRERGIR